MANTPRQERTRIPSIAWAAALILVALAAGCRQSRNNRFEASGSTEQFLRLYLDAMSEPPLQNIIGESYRFLYIPTFTEPVAVRASCNKNHCVVTAKKLNGQGGYGPGALAREISRDLTQQEWRHFQELVAESQFWSISKEIYQLGLGPMDASLWVLEGSRLDQHRVWIDWSMNQGDDPGLRRMCLKLLEISRLDLELSELD